jgi:hypothetical protein
MNKSSEDDLQHCFRQGKICMEWLGVRGGGYIEVTTVVLRNFLIKMF